MAWVDISYKFSINPYDISSGYGQITESVQISEQKQDRTGKGYTHEIL